MSSCCLAACGRLAENSQPGEAAFNSLWTGSPGTSAPSAGSRGRGGPCGVLGLWFWRVGGVWGPTASEMFSHASPRAVPAAQREGASCWQRALSSSLPDPPRALQPQHRPLLSPRPTAGCGTGLSAPQPLSHGQKPILIKKKKVAIRVWCLGALRCLQGAAAPGPPAPLYDSGCPFGRCLWAGRGVRDVWRAPGGPRAQGAAAQSQQRNKAHKIVFHNQALRLAQEAWRWVRVGRHEVYGPLPTPLTQLRCCRSLLLLLSYLWALPFGPCSQDLGRSQLLLVVADLVRTIASRAPQMTRFYL